MIGIMKVILSWVKSGHEVYEMLCSWSLAWRKGRFGARRYEYIDSFSKDEWLMDHIHDVHIIFYSLSIVYSILSVFKTSMFGIITTITSVSISACFYRPRMLVSFLFDVPWLYFVCPVLNLS